MLTNVKMEVTKELANEINRIVCESNGEISNPIECDYSYAYIKQDIDGNNRLFFSNDYYLFKKYICEEISALAFIQTNGTLKELPKVGKEYLFYDNEDVVFKGKFKTYFQGSMYPFREQDGNGYKHFKEIKEISFIDFLKENDCYEKFMENIKPENQRWTDVKNYKTLNELKEYSPEFWIFEAFNFKFCNEGEEFWSDLYDKWYKIVDNQSVVWEYKI